MSEAKPFRIAGKWWPSRLAVIRHAQALLKVSPMWEPLGWQAAAFVFGVARWTGVRETFWPRSAYVAPSEGGCGGSPCFWIETRGLERFPVSIHRVPKTDTSPDQC